MRATPENFGPVDNSSLYIFQAAHSSNVLICRLWQLSKFAFLTFVSKEYEVLLNLRSS